MNLIKRYVEYIKDNPKGYWFKRRIFGWGWVPATWQGWMVVVIFLIYVVLIASIFLPEEGGFEYSLSLLVGIVILIYACYKKGEKPRWIWGFR